MIWYRKERIKCVGEDENGIVLWEKYYTTRTLYLGTERIPIIAWNHPIKQAKL